MKLELLQGMIKMRSFLPKYCGIEYNTTAKNKMRGKDSRNKECAFSAEEYKRIKTGFNKLVKDLKSDT